MGKKRIFYPLLLLFGLFFTSCYPSMEDYPRNNPHDPVNKVCSCEGKECGDDGCGNSCGTCQEGFVCNEQGKCVCTPDCSEKECGDDGCGGSCGTCPCGNECLFGKCVFTACNFKECGDDGCGGSCGDCLYDEVCIDHKCYKNYCLKGVGEAGCCLDGTKRVYCVDGKMFLQVCDVCGFDQESQKYVCGKEGKDKSGVHPYDCECKPNCYLKECGDDSCFGSCGECPENFECIDYKCVCKGVLCGDECCSENEKCENNKCVPQ